jgi:hypothetical protein
MSTFHAVSLRHQKRSTSEDTLKLRLRVYLARARLDRQIVAGRPCKSTAALALRSSQLVEPRTRQQSPVPKRYSPTASVHCSIATPSRP